MKTSDIDYKELSPMMKQYIDIKKNYEEEFLFYRVGDFYELFFEDALKASRELGITLTGKNGGLKERIPMAGVPHHSVKTYIEKLIEKGYKVAICDQVEDPRYTKGMVKREVTEVISKGTIIDLDLLNSNDFNYIGSILDFNYTYVLTYADISTGNIYSEYIQHNNDSLINRVINLNLKEIIINKNFDLSLINSFKNDYNINITIIDNYYKEELDILKNIKKFEVQEGVKHLFYYLIDIQLKDITHFNDVEIKDNREYLLMDIHTVRNLELFETQRHKERKYSLIWLLDRCKTSMGSRTLKEFLTNPLKNVDKINERLDYIEKFNTEFIYKEELSNLLYEVYDLERLCGKVVSRSLNGRDMLQIKKTLKVLPDIIDILNKLKLDIKIDDHKNIYDLLEKSIYEDPPVTIKEGYLIKEGYSPKLDELKSIRSGGKDYLSKLEQEEKDKTKISNLKLGYNKVFGYYIEVTKSNLDKVKDEFGWERKQTLANAERYITKELKEKESLILNAEERIIELEYDLFNEIKEIIKKNIIKLKKTAKSLGYLDALISLSIVSDEYSLVRPKFNDKHIINIKNGFHPVVSLASKIEYVKNDCIMDKDINTLLITGPNMSGKSTYMRQLAIIVIMAQIGSFVPADAANIPIFDQIFTRIGASDDLVSGESTFMVEMLEAKNALVNATKNSLILFDELGRGTATYDGMSLAEAILEYITVNIGCKTLFSTHYHELTKLEKRYKTIKNIHVSATEDNGNLVFLHKVKEGSVDKSYGVNVAALANIPDEVIKRATELLAEYEKGTNKKEPIQLSFNIKEKDELREKLKEIDIYELTPLDALNKLNELKEISKK